MVRTELAMIQLKEQSIKIETKLYLYEIIILCIKDNDRSKIYNLVICEIYLNLLDI